MDTCQVVLEKAVGLSAAAHWVLVAQQASPNGLVAVATCGYSSDNHLANFQASKPQFLRARDTITNELLSSGWQLVGASGDTLCLPRFRRPAGYQTSTQPVGATGSGVILTKVAQRTLEADKFHIVVDGDRVTSMGNAETLRLDLPPGLHSIRVDSARPNTGWRKSEDYSVDVRADSYARLSFGYVSSFFSIRIVVRGEELSPEPSDRGKSFDK